jgi:hypothetical protein
VGGYEASSFRASVLQGQVFSGGDKAAAASGRGVANAAAVLLLMMVRRSRMLMMVRGAGWVEGAGTLS